MSWSLFGAARTKISVLSLAALVAAACVAVTAPGASADSAPPAGTPATVTNDALPTVQINGTVWAQVTVGNTVYVAGSFTSARPAGSPAGTNEVPRGNLLAYDLTTGALIAGFNHTLNAQALAIAASPDGSTVYVGGQFTTVDGIAHSRLASFKTATGALNAAFLGRADASVRSLTATATTLYAGGDFKVAGGSISRPYAAAYNGVTGAVTTWNAGVNNSVLAMTVSPDKTKLILGGRFTTLSGLSRYGLGAVDLTTGLPTTWVPNPVVRDAGANSGITSLSADANQIYGTGYVFGAGGNVEGRFSIDATGKLIWLNSCHGDSYSAFPIGSVLYAVSHSHACNDMSAFPETNPRSFHHAVAETTYATGTLKANTISGYSSFAGQPDSTQLDWYPTLTTGVYTGQDQAAWSVTGNANYISLGGEFPKVNGVSQQGLVRFAVSTIAPNTSGPVASTALTPLATVSGASVKLTWGSTYDADSAVLKYTVLRDGTIPVGNLSADTRFWTVPAPSQTLTDTTAPNGPHTYTVVASDSFGNSVTSAKSAIVTVTGAVTTTPVVFASDSFNRTVAAGGLGAADIGGSWTSASTVSAQSVTPGAAKFAMTAGTTSTGVLTATSQPNAVVTSTISFDKVATGGGAYFSLAGRRVNSTNEYRANVHQLSSGAVTAYLTKLDGSSTEVPLGSVVTLPAPLAAGAALQLKFSVQTTAGVTSLGFKAWPAGSAEPAAWQSTASDSSAALQVAASVGMRAYLSGSATSPVTVSVSAFEATQS